jgi:hypothetical protein
LSIPTHVRSGFETSPDRNVNPFHTPTLTKDASCGMAATAWFNAADSAKVDMRGMSQSGRSARSSARSLAGRRAL